jgi:hypothetical protein
LDFGNPFTPTDTNPLVAPGGTWTVIKVSLMVMGDATVPLNNTFTTEAFVPNPFPFNVMIVPIPPLAGLRLVRPGPLSCLLQAKKTVVRIRGKSKYFIGALPMNIIIKKDSTEYSRCF